MRTHIKKLMPRDVVLCFGGKWSLILGLIIRSHEIRDDPEDSLGDLISGVLIEIVWGRCFGNAGGALRRLPIKRDFWCRIIRFPVRGKTRVAAGQRAEHEQPKEFS